MAKRIAGLAFEGARLIRDAAREDMSVLCPSADVSFDFVRASGQVQVTAKVEGDTSPYERSEVAEYLRFLGLQQVEVVEPEPIEVETAMQV